LLRRIGLTPNDGCHPSARGSNGPDDCENHDMLQGREDFTTHFNYVTKLESLSQGVSITCRAGTKVTNRALELAAGKRQLIALTQQSLDDEKRIVDADPQYSQAAVLWLPVKSYYLLYHVLSLVEFIISSNPPDLSIGHTRLIKNLTQRLSNGELSFSDGRFNRVLDQRIFDFKERSGAHLSPYASDELIFNLLMKKTATYKRDDEVRRQRWKLRTVEGRRNRDQFVSRMNVSIFDYFHFMRLNASYRGFRFIEDVPIESTASYFAKYFRMTRNFYECFDGLRSVLENMPTPLPDRAF
jgi:hypothetical protein